MVNIQLSEEDKDTLLIMLGLATGRAAQINPELAGSFLCVTNAIIVQFGGTPYKSIDDLRTRAHEDVIAVGMVEKFARQ